MKKLVVKLAAACFLLSSVAMAQDEDHKEKRPEPKFKKTKAYSKSYSLGSSDKVSLTNQFGEMKINTWDKNEVKVDVQIEGKSDDERRAQEILDRISISDGKGSGTVFFKTKFEDQKDDKDKNREHRNEGMKINYTVYLPAGNALHASNQFGPMTIPDYRGPIELESKFGSLKAGKLTNAKEVSLEFGKGEIQEVSGGQLNIKFSEGTVGQLSGDVNTDLEFSQVKLNLDNDVKSLNIDNSYSSVYLDLEKNFSANWDIRTSHGEFSNKTAFAIKEEGGDTDKGYGPKFNRTYKGVSGGGAAKVKINSSFGEIVAGHDLQVDFSKKHKTKTKTNTKVI
jgi:hypothetical protein